MPDDLNRFARDLFDGLPARYDRLAELLSLGQNGRWRAEMVGHVVPVDGVILDVASGTAGVALQLAARSGGRAGPEGTRVVGVDLTEQMLRQGQRRVAAAGQRDRIALLTGRAEQLPFPDASFDALTFTYLLRYVNDPQATLTELARVLKPGGMMASLEFCVPPGPLWRPAWWAYTRLALPAGGLLLGGREWYQVGRFLGPNISAHYRRYPVAWTVEAWQKAGLTDVRTRVMSLGGGLVMWGSVPASETEAARPAYYAARPGPWRDWWTLLHPPYTAWHLSYVVIGAALAPQVRISYLIATVLAFFLAVGLAAHALDELRGRPLRTAIPSAALAAVVVAGLLGALALGVFGVIRVGWTLIPYMVAGPVLVIAYNAELFGGLMHTDFGFAAAWGAFPVLTAYTAQTGTLALAPVLAAIGAFALSAAQRRLSMPARNVRRRAERVEGSITFADGRIVPITADALLEPLERALRAASWAIILLAAALAVARLA